MTAKCPLDKNCLDLPLNCCPLIFNDSSSRDSWKHVFSAHVESFRVWVPVYMLWFLLFFQWTFTACFFGPHTEFLLPPPPPCCAATWHFRWKIKCDWPWTKLPYCHVCARAPWFYCSLSSMPLDWIPSSDPRKIRAANQSNPSWWQPTRSLRTNNQQIRKLVIHLHCKLNSIPTGACPRRRMDWWERLQSSASSHIFLSRVS